MGLSGNPGLKSLTHYTEDKVFHSWSRKIPGAGELLSLYATPAEPTLYGQAAATLRQRAEASEARES